MISSVRVLPAWCGVCLILAAGCGTLQLPDYPARSTADYQYKATGEELSLSVHPLVTRSEVKKYFGTNLLGRGVLPVYFLVENRGATSSFVVADEDFSLRGVGEVGDDELVGENKPQVHRSDVVHDPEDRGMSVAMGAVQIISPAIYLVAVFPAMDAMSDKAEIKRNFVAKQFRIKTISPQESASGFLYFRLPEKRGSPDKWVIHAEISGAGNEKAEQLDAEFHWRR